MVRVFLLQHMEKSEWTFGPTEQISEDKNFDGATVILDYFTANWTFLSHKDWNKQNKRNETKPKMKHAAITQPTQGTPGIFPGKLKLFISGFIHSSQNQGNPEVLWQVNS